MKEQLLQIVDKAIFGLDKLIDPKSRGNTPLTPEEQASFDRWHQVERPSLKAKGIDIEWGDPHN